MATGMETQTRAFTSLPEDCVLRCLEFFGKARTMCNLMATCKRMQDLLSEDTPWEAFCRVSLGLLDACVPEETGSTRLVQQSWRCCARTWVVISKQLDPLGLGVEGVEPRGLRGLDIPMYTRVLKMWSSLEGFYDAHLPVVRESLSEGLAYDAFCSFLTALHPDQDLSSVFHRWKTFWYIYSVHNGQNLAYDLATVRGITSGRRSNVLDIFKGMIGGYSAYDHRINTRLWSLDVIKYFVDQDNRFLPVAGSFNLDKLFGFLPRSIEEQGFVIISPSGQTRPAIPGSVYEGFDDKKDEGAEDAKESPNKERGTLGLLLWLEEFTKRTTSGVYTVDRLIQADHNRSMILFPARPGTLGCTRVLTRGIEVQASSIYMIEHRMGWTYSIRVRLLTPDEAGYQSPEERGFTTCQLRARHWVVTDGRTGETEHVRGEGVVGRYPLLFEGGYRDDSQNNRGNITEGARCEGTFIYQSCSGRVGHGQGGSFGGELVFVPGTLVEPTGSDFDVTVETFPLRRPDFFY